MRFIITINNITWLIEIKEKTEMFLNKHALRIRIVSAIRDVMEIVVSEV